MNVSCWIYPAAVCISPPIGTSQADPQGTSSDRLGDIVLSRAEPSLTALTNAARLDSFSDFIKSKKRGGQLGPRASALRSIERVNEPVDEHADAW
jgi:hypothetical protein